MCGACYSASKSPYHRKGKVHDYFSSLSWKSSIWFTEKHMFKIIIYFFNMKCATKYVTWFEVYNGFIGQKILKLRRQESWPIQRAYPLWANWPRLSCPYSDNTLGTFCRPWFIYKLVYQFIKTNNMWLELTVLVYTVNIQVYTWTIKVKGQYPRAFLV